MQNLNWVSCEGNVWCDLLRLNLTNVGQVEGVYIIWHGGFQPHAVRVGQGKIAERLREHRANSNILAYDYLGLGVTWSEVPVGSRDGIEKFLSNALKPLVGEAFPGAQPIRVNLPPIPNLRNYDEELLSALFAMFEKSARLRGVSVTELLKQTSNGPMRMPDGEPSV